MILDLSLNSSIKSTRLSISAYGPSLNPSSKSTCLSISAYEVSLGWKIAELCKQVLEYPILSPESRSDFKPNILDNFMSLDNFALKFLEVERWRAQVVISQFPAEGCKRKRVMT
ncbi:hypothetical protein Tco_0649040 [Tanacetum coccineum]